MSGSNHKTIPVRRPATQPCLPSSHAHFILPPKGKNPWAINRPATQKDETNNADSVSCIKHAPRSADLGNTPKGADRQGHEKAVDVALMLDVGTTHMESKSATSNSTLARSQISAFDEQKPSRLDIYARKYVPLWLLLVNESPAVPVYAPFIKHIDLQTYKASFVGRDFASELPSIDSDEARVLRQTAWSARQSQALCRRDE